MRNKQKTIIQDLINLQTERINERKSAEYYMAEYDNQYARENLTEKNREAEKSKIREKYKAKDRELKNKFNTLVDELNATCNSTITDISDELKKDIDTINLLGKNLSSADITSIINKHIGRENELRVLRGVLKNNGFNTTQIEGKMVSTFANKMNKPFSKDISAEEYINSFKNTSDSHFTTLCNINNLCKKLSIDDIDTSAYTSAIKNSKTELSSNAMPQNSYGVF